MEGKGGDQTPAGLECSSCRPAGPQARSRLGEGPSQVSPAQWGGAALSDKVKPGPGQGWREEVMEGHSRAKLNGMFICGAFYRSKVTLSAEEHKNV